MIIAAATAVAAICVVVFLLNLVLEEQTQVSDMGQLVAKSKPVDIAALRNLISRAEEDYLKARLSSEDFRLVQRVRMEAALEYAQRIYYNAALVLQLARAHRDTPRPEAAMAAEQLANSALRMRIFAMLAICIIRARILAPELGLRTVAIVERYEALRDSMNGLSRIQYPSAASQVDAAL